MDTPQPLPENQVTDSLESNNIPTTKHKTLNLLLLLLLIISLATSGFLFYQNKVLINTSLVSQPVESLAPSPIASPEPTPSDWKATKIEVVSVLEKYLEALLNEDREAAMKFLTTEIQNQVEQLDQLWPKGYGNFTTYEILNEFSSEQEEQEFYSQDQLTFSVKLYGENNKKGNLVRLLFMKEDRNWKTLTWYLFP